MTEAQVRQKVLAIMQGWVGLKRSDRSHAQIIDTYNENKPLPRGYKVSYTDDYCATTVSAAAIKAGYTDIMPIECSCGKLIEIAKKMRIWQENDAYVPSSGDLILYDWQDGANFSTTDNKGAPDHVGMVEKVSGRTITIIEGNMSGGIVGRRTVTVNGRYIRGYICPPYATKASGAASGDVAGNVDISGQSADAATKLYWLTAGDVWTMEEAIAAKKSFESKYPGIPLGIRSADFASVKVLG